MRNVTVTLDEKVADWSRVWAARNNTSVSRMLGELLAEKMLRDERYSAAMEEFLAIPPIMLNLGSASAEHPYPAREMLHER